jgi:hypothetical protein
MESCEICASLCKSVVYLHCLIIYLWYIYYVFTTVMETDIKHVNSICISNGLIFMVPDTIYECTSILSTYPLLLIAVQDRQGIIILIEAQCDYHISMNINLFSSFPYVFTLTTIASGCLGDKLTQILFLL